MTDIQAMSSDMKDTELETRIENMLDFFTQPGEKYLKDLQNDLVDLIKRETDKAVETALQRLYDNAKYGEDWTANEVLERIELALNQLKQSEDR